MSDILLLVKLTINFVIIQLAELVFSPNTIRAKHLLFLNTSAENNNK